MPEAGILAQKLLEERLEKKGYTQSEYTPGFWTHEWRPISFALTVDDFAVKYVGKEHAQHLLSALEEDYECKADWKGTRYIGLTLDWDYENREVHISMPGYVAEALKDSITRCQRSHNINHTHMSSQHTAKKYNMQ